MYYLFCTSPERQKRWCDDDDLEYTYKRQCNANKVNKKLNQ